MKIRMITLGAGPMGVLEAGRVYEVDEQTGRAMIAGHYATPVMEPAASSQPPVEEPKPVETADVPPLTAEKAFRPSPRRRSSKE